MNKKLNFILLAIALNCFLAITTLAQTTTFTYQGRLNDASSAANGTYDLGFALFDAASGGGQIGTAQTRAAVTVTNGVFTVQLDFGAAAFPGANRFLEIAVKKPSDANFTTLAPRQPITSTPYAIRALSATNADSATNAVQATTATNAQQLGNVAAGQFVQTNSETFIRNQTTQQTGANFNVSGTGKAGVFDATNYYSINGERILSTPGSYNLFIGVNAGASITSGDTNTFVGGLAGQNNTKGNQNSFLGFYTGYYNTEGTFNAFFGSYAGFHNTKGNENSFFGINAGESNSTGSNNSFFGNASGTSNSIGYYNSFFGQSAGFSNNSGYRNSFFGAGAGQSNEIGFQNSSFGAFAGGETTTGILNLFLGAEAGLYNKTGSNNVFVGAKSGNVNTTGGNITTIGFGAEVGIDNLDHATAIGAGATVNANNTIALGRSNGTDKVVVYGLGVANTNTTLCRNTLNQIAPCSREAPLAKPENENGQKSQITDLQTQVAAQAKQIDEQKLMISALKKLVCASNATADLCRQQ